MSAHADVVVRELGRIDDLAAAEALFAATWASQPPATAALLKALVHAGGYVAGAYRGGTVGGSDGELIGAAAAFLAEHDGPALHSHLAAVTPAARGLGVGEALKRHQRTWAAAHGLRVVTWTFDPLIRCNAWFNIAKLGARVEEYLPDFYGPMDDGVNDGDATDRLLVVWPVTPEPGAGVSPSPAPQAAPVLEDADGRPRPRQAPDDVPRGGHLLAAATPPDVESLRRTDPELALAWRYALREALAPLLERGRVVAFTRAGSYLVDPDADAVR
jgi:predicted GNAT superfamily acetyltransferase